MENAVDALKIAFAVMIFAMALTLSISSFSNASSAIDSIIQMRDRETEYTYVEPSGSLTRKVGIETVVTTMYRAIEQNIEIHFFDSYGEPLELFYNVNDDGNIISSISSIDFSNEKNGKYKTPADAKLFLDILLGGKRTTMLDETQKKWMIDKYEEQGIYEEFKSTTFEEELGEYDDGAQIKKRVITYTIQNP